MRAPNATVQPRVLATASLAGSAWCHPFAQRTGGSHLWLGGTDTAGFTDHVFVLMHLLGFRFAPRIRDLGDTKLYIPKGEAAYDALKSMIGGTLNIKHVRAHWDEILRLAASI